MPLGPFLDALGDSLTLPAPPRRIVSLVPSVTELLFALGAGPAVAGCTVFCTEPAEGVATKPRIGGEKNPRLEAIRDLGADLVVANVEENVRGDVETLRSWGIAVYVIYPRRVVDGIRLVRELGELTGHADEGRRMAADLLGALEASRLQLQGRTPRRVFYPIWRRPWMTISRDTYAHDMLHVCGGLNVFAGSETRYPEVTLEEVAQRAPEVILLPDEPYRFRRAHLADFDAHGDVPAVRFGRLHLIDGKLATWYGPRIAQALRELPRLLAES
ncbi:MAG TPA: helical backbone metal receptor [Candidatus Bathyarchaeia archaeon]|nr:helical backbone metal receptor [Candidatus Bathyarchaeia archaeon]